MSEEILNEELLAEATDAPESQETEQNLEAADEETLAATPVHLISDLTEIERAVEALIFASPKPLSKLKIKNALKYFNYDISSLDDVLLSLEQVFETRGHQLIKVSGGYQFRTHPQVSDVIQKLVEEKPTKLSNSALEVLAIIAYKQPLTRSEIDAIRGIDSGHLLRGLLEKNLVRTEGHADGPGRPLLYGTTPYFLEVFTMNSLDDLPAIEEFQRELSGLSDTDNHTSGEGEAPLVLNPDPNFYDRESPLAANPDRGAFDEKSEEEFSSGDFGLNEIALKDEKGNPIAEA